MEPSDDTQAVDFLEGLDKRMYGDMLRDLKNRVRNNEAVYPDTLSGAHAYAKNYIPPYVRQSEARSSKSVYHTTTDYGVLPAPALPAVAVAESKPQKKMCTECGRFHFGNCWGRNREKSPFATPKVVNVVDGSDNGVNNKKADSASSDDESHYYVGAPDNKGSKCDTDITHVIYKCSMNDKVYESNPMIVYLDSCANAHVIHNVELLYDIKQDDGSAIVVKGVGGETTLRESGRFPCFGEVHILGTENRVNILSLGKVEDMYPVEFIRGNFRVTINSDVVLLF